MILTIDLSNKTKLILSENKKKIDVFEWDGLYQLSETLLINLDKLLKKNKLKLFQIKQIKIIESKKSIVGNRIAKAMAMGLKCLDKAAVFE